MHSPFPGMDPFLEDPSEWGGVHAWLIPEIGAALAPVIAPDFYVKIEKRVYITTPDEASVRQQIVPDAYIATHSTGESVQATLPSIEISPHTRVEPLEDAEEVERYIEIRDARSREVVTIIEVLSPYNKTSAADGFQRFQEKRRRVMASAVNWIEIDLLRAGQRPPEVGALGDYYALLKRGHERAYQVWYFNLRDPMPTIVVPLASSRADVPLVLQAVFNAVYERGYYAASIDYDQPIPAPKLSPADKLWVQAQIEAWRERRADSSRSA